jgi:phosphoglycolate phosphatase-like HAD superfamily hydrolase
MRLLLFDIDGTLVDTRGAGLAALLDAVEEVFEVPRGSVPPLDLAGATDGAVLRALFQHLGLADEASLRQRYLTHYLKHLERRLHDDAFHGVSLPGVMGLITELARLPEVGLGLLTGNVRAGAGHKLKRFGLDAFFEEGAFGDDADDRNLLGPVAVRRFESRVGRAIPVDEVIVIGDTVKDVACAKALGARCLAVATGVHGRAGLVESGAWHCLDDLEEVAKVVELLTGPLGRAA